jgi:hypothetical protein
MAPDVRKRLVLTAIVLTLATVMVRAQEGHPLTGTWSGDWGPDATDRRHLTVVMSWEGDAITAIVNPGPDAVTVPAVQLDVTSWTVRLEGQRPGGEQGGPIVAEGRLEDLGSPHRTLSGTWREGDTAGTFRLTRD